MNLLILQNDDFTSSNTATLSGRRYTHLKEILNIQVGQSVKVGKLNGLMGSATIASTSSESATLTNITLDQEPPPPLPLTLILALPRPRMLQRSLQTIATMGVQHLCLIQTSRVEKSFWQTPLLKPETVEEHLLLGLEQGKATQLPKINYFQRFRPFVEDHLEALCGTKKRFIAHPGDFPYPENQGNTPSVLAIGPEGGFIEKEVNTFRDAGFQALQLGNRILRVETAVPVLLAKLYN